MVKFLGDKESKLIFDYLDSDRSALLSCITEYYPDSYLENGVFSMQYNDFSPTALCAYGEKFSLLFTSDKTDFEELSFTLKGEIHSPDILPFTIIDKYYLLQKQTFPNSDFHLENKQNYEDFKSVLNLNKSAETVNLQYLFKKGRAVPFVLSENTVKIGGGLIINSENYSVISHIYVKENFRGKGFGTEIVENLLKYASSEKTYLISEENNLEFYGKLGFSSVFAVNKYSTGA